MIDIKLIREKPEEVKAALLKRMDDVDFAGLLGWDARRRALMNETDQLRKRRNDVSGQIPRLKKEGKDAGDFLTEMKEVSTKIKNNDVELAALLDSIQTFLEGLPNIPADDVVAGDKENNEVVRTWGAKPSFDFEPRDHVDLVTSLGIVDYERGTKMGGAGFWLYKGIGAQLEWALVNYFIEEHIKDGYQFIMPPHLLNWQCGYTAGQFPKFTDDVFHLQPEENKERRLFLLPTAETALTNLHRDEIIPEKDLPCKYFAYTPCFRREAGSYRTEERGMIRGHQFNKVEIFQYTKPEDSADALEEMTGKAEKLVQDLGLHYQVSKLAANDCSASMAKTYDIEVWIPSMNQYKEVSSASNALDYQARRGNMRYKRRDTGKTELVHTLNASGLATSRLLPALAEQFQQADGSVIVPEALRARIGTHVIKPTEG